MTPFLKYLKSEILNEGKPVQEAPRKISLFLTTMKDKFLQRLFNDFTYWQESPDLKAAMAISPYDTEHICISWNPAELDKMTSDMIRFTLQHEIYHILYEHHGRFKDHLTKTPPNLRKISPQIANICMDAFINQDIINDGGIDGGAVKPPYYVYSFTTEQPPDYGTVEKWIQDTLGNPKLKYTGPKTEFDLYDWVVSQLKDLKNPPLPPGEPPDGPPGEPPDQPPPPPPNEEIKVGDTIQDMDSKDWGKVTSIDPDGTVHYDKMTQKEIDAEREKGARMMRNIRGIY